MKNSASTTENIIQIQANASLMTFDAGLYCIFLSAPIEGRVSPGYPAVKVSQAPNMPRGLVTISTLDEENFISGAGGAALVRVNRGPAQVLVTTYRVPNDTTEIPGVQVARLGGPGTPAGDGGAAIGQSAPTAAGADGSNAQRHAVSAHVRQQGDVSGDIGSWIGKVGGEKWIEGFTFAPTDLITAQDVEYQAMLGKGWLSPWVEGGTFCGSRGMALPILGLRIRLKEQARSKARITIEASFVDGTRVKETDADEVISAESFAPLEAFRLQVMPSNSAGNARSKPVDRTDGIGREKPSGRR